MLLLRILLTIYFVGAALTLISVYLIYWRARPLPRQRYAVVARWIATLLLVLVWFITWPIAIYKAAITAWHKVA